MKRYILLFGILFCLFTLLFSQARVNEALPIIDENVKSLSFTGWVKDHAGQWQTAQNMIPSEYWDTDGDTELGLDNIVSLKLFSVVYESKKFYVLEIIKRERQRDEFWNFYIVNRGYYYVIENQNFNISIETNVSRVNNLILFSSFNTLEPLNDENRAQHLLQFVKNPQLLLERRVPRGSGRLQALGIPTFYYHDENAVRFFINGIFIGGLEASARFRELNFYDTLQGNFYYECSYDDFIKFFNPAIIE